MGSKDERCVVRADCIVSTACCDHNYLSAATRLSGNEVPGGDAPHLTCDPAYENDLPCLAYHEGMPNDFEPSVVIDTTSCTHVKFDETAKSHSGEDGKKLHTLREHSYLTGNLIGGSYSHIESECHLSH